MSVNKALTTFIEHYQQARPMLEEPYDPSWRSPCEIAEPYLHADGEQRIAWRPVRRGVGTMPVDDFGGLENALGVPIHPDIREYYGSFWSAGLEAKAPDGHVSLLLLWNADDAERLIENLIGHALAKQRARSPFSVFFACTEPDSELFLTVDNATGAVMLEKPGYKPVREVARSLTAFLATLVPASPDPQPGRATPGT